MKIKKVLSQLTSLLIFASISIANAQSKSSLTKHIDLTNEKPDWQSVIGGVAMAPVLETSYGIAVLTDGRMLSSCTSKGNVIWKKGVSGRPTKYMTQHKDFIYVVTNDKRITLVNQSGLNLWTANNSFKITENPVIGPDGRIFVHGENNIACFGINGTRKWNIETPKLANLPTCLLNDGSVVVFLATPKDGRTIGKRFSQFGEEKEDLLFSSIVKTAVTCEQGILVGLENGSIGICNVVKGKADSPWIQKSYISSAAFAICYSEETKNTAFFFQTGGNTTVIVLRTENGEFINQFTIGNFNASTIELAKKTNSGYFIADSSNACEFTEDGSILWTAKLPSKSIWNFLYYTNSNHLIFCMKDWSLNSYHTMQTTKAVYKDFWDDSYSSDLGEYIEDDYGTPDKPEDSIKRKKISEEDRNLGIQVFSDEKLEEAERRLKDGDYGRYELEYLSGIKSELGNYIETFYTTNPNQSFFAKNPIYTQRLLKMTAQIGCAEFTTDFATLLRFEQDPILLSAIVYASGQQCYDPDGEILTSYEIIIRKPTMKGNNVLLKNICDATYTICRYMGRPALNKHGKEILTQLSSQSYDRSVRDYARKTFESFANLNM